MQCDGLIVGLGNPGAEYAATRHNIGFMVVDALLAIPGADWQQLKTKGKYELWKGVLPGTRSRLLLAKPMTFMNLSGQAVQHMLGYYAIPLDKLLVVHDELDLPLGRLRFKVGGGVAGHNGLSSIVALLGTPGFARLRMGIGRPARTGEVSRFVLSPFPTAEEDIVRKMVAAALEGIGLVYSRGMEQAMQRLHPSDVSA
jgi:PTH1 family peptidyl-tRNA hydrolase